jgi:hypothetical protein
VGLIGGKSGFRTGRDLALFVVGVLIAGVHLASTFSDPSQVSLPLIVTAGGFMGAPYVLKKDERK